VPFETVGGEQFGEVLQMDLLLADGEQGEGFE
jgi:hypothetical protein